MVWNMESRDRKRQIDTLKIFNAGVVEKKENCEYEVEFMSGNNQIKIEVILGPEFPKEKPLLRVNPMVSHPWIAQNSRDITGAPGLLNFTNHSDLGRVVQAIIRDFKHSPPQIISNMNPEDEIISSAPSLNADKYNNPMSTGSGIPEFDELSNDQLELLNEHPEYMDKFIEEMPAAIEMEKSLNKLMEDIEKLAKDNLSKEGEIETMKSGIKSRIDKISLLKRGFEEKYFHHKKLTQAYTPKAIVESLHVLASEADKEAENIAKSFLAGEMDLDTFIKSYETTRSLGLKRRMKQESLANQLAQLNRAGLPSK